MQCPDLQNEFVLTELLSEWNLRGNKFLGNLLTSKCFCLVNKFLGNLLERKFAQT